METRDVIRARRNVRDYEDRPVPTEDLDWVLEAARLTPSSQNRQRWEFVAVTDRGQLEKLAEAAGGSRHVSTSAATVALVAPDADSPGARESIRYDLGQATMSIMLAAADLGIGSGHAGVRDRDAASQALGLPDDRFCPMLVTLGYPADGPIRPIEHDRRPFDDVVRRERFQ